MNNSKYSKMSATEIVKLSKDEDNYIDTMRAGECLRAFMMLAAADEPLVKFAKLSAGFQREANELLQKRYKILSDMLDNGILTEDAY
jgi:hypothetical protein